MLGNSMLAPEVKRLIQTCAALNVRLSRRLPNLDFLIWASPTACRNPDSTWLWHPSFLKKSLIVHFLVHAYSLIRYTLSGFCRFFQYHGFWFRFHERGGEMILVMPEEITDKTPTDTTPYLLESETVLLDKLVFSQAKPAGTCYSRLTPLLKFTITLKLLRALVTDFKEQKKMDRYSLTAVTLFFRWIVSQGWYFHWDFYHLMDEILDARKNRYKIAFSLHEMYFYARTLWNLAKKYRLTRVTAQHALIVPERLVWFREKTEIEAGCPGPDRFFVYGEESLALFQPYFPNTTFLFCCSPRFNHWKKGCGEIFPREREIGSVERYFPERALANATAREGNISLHTLNHNARREQFSPQTILIIGSMMSFDVKILVQAMKRLFRDSRFRGNDNFGFNIRVRLHPHSDMNLRDRLWIRSASKKGKIVLSKSSLKEDFALASLVIGCNTAALPESILLGIPTLTVFRDDYICPTMIEQSEAWEISVDKISWERLYDQINSPPSDELIHRFKNKMGLFHPDLTTEFVQRFRSPSALEVHHGFSRSSALSSSDEALNQ